MRFKLTRNYASSVAPLYLDVASVSTQLTAITGPAGLGWVGMLQHGMIFGIPALFPGTDRGLTSESRTITSQEAPYFGS